MKTENPTPQYVAYYRVSTDKQGRSGLGLSAQKTMVEGFTGCSDCIVGQYVETESGKNNERPELAKAIADANQRGAKLIIAKLDRLSRNAGFIFQLKDSGVDFVAADMPDANTLTIGIFATIAQHERETISARTKAALEAKKAQGVQLGNPENLTKEAQQKGVQGMKNKAAANENNRRAAGYAKALRDSGLSWSAIAERLNSEGFRTARGKQFQAVQVQRVMKRA